MAVTLGSLALDPAMITVRETHEEIGGRRERVIEISGMFAGLSSVTAIHDALDAILDAASTEDYSAVLSVRSGRRMFVRRTAFAREVSKDALTGSFKLKLGTRGPFEESTALHQTFWPIAASGVTLTVSTSGTAPAQVVLELTAVGTIVGPSFSDGRRTIAYNGTLHPGDILVLDGANGAASLNGEDVLPYVTGVFPLIVPGESSLSYQDDAGSSHYADVTVEYRDRWW